MVFQALLWNGLLLTLAGLCVVSFVVTFLLQLAAHIKLSQRPPRVADKSLPPLSVLKPLRGVDAGLADNLRCFARQDYPRFELIFGVEDQRDPAVEIVQQLKREFPQVKITLVVGGPQPGLNPKVNNLANMSRYARYEHVLISDADVHPRVDYLRALSSELSDPQVRLVHSVVMAKPVGNSGAILESFQLCSFVASTVCAASIVGHACVVGKSMLFRRSDLERLGGFSAVENLLAEDYVLGRRFEEAGFRVVASTHALEARNPGRTLQGFFDRHVRWSQMRRRLCLSAYAAEPMANPTPWLLLFGLTALGSPLGPKLQAAAAAAAVSGLLLRCLGDGLLAQRLTGYHRVWKRLPWVIVKDIVIFVAWLFGFIKRRVHWRGHEMLIGKESRLYPCATEEAVLQPVGLRHL